MDLILGVNKGSIANVPKDDGGVARPVDGPIICTAIPDGIVHLEANPDGSICEVIGVAMGTATYGTFADADPGEGDSRIIGNPITINVSLPVAQRATHIESTEGPVVPQ